MHVVPRNYFSISIPNKFEDHLEHASDKRITSLLQYLIRCRNSSMHWLFLWLETLPRLFVAVNFNDYAVEETNEDRKYEKHDKSYTYISCIFWKSNFKVLYIVK